MPKLVQITLHKQHQSSKLGLQLDDLDGKQIGIQVEASGPLSKMVKPNSVLQSINGVQCEDKEQAMGLLNDAQGEVNIVISEKKRSLFRSTSKLLAKRPSRQSSNNLRTSPDDSIVPAPSSEPEAITPDEPTPEEPNPEELAPEPPSLLSSFANAFTAPPPAPAEAMATLSAEEGTFKVMLQLTEGNSSIGLRLQQAASPANMGLPSVEAIYPMEPAAQTDIMPGDIVLEINGVSADAPPEALKAAILSYSTVELKLRRPIPASYRSEWATTEDAHETAAPEQASTEMEMMIESKADAMKKPVPVKMPTQKEWFAGCCAVPRREPVRAPGEWAVWPRGPGGM